MALRSEIYRSRAVECEVAANKANDREAKHTYDELAKHWRKLACRIAELERDLLDQSEAGNEARQVDRNGLTG
jgi:hypothetical protein